MERANRAPVKYASRARVAVVGSHPIQYQVPWLRALAGACDLTVFYAQKPSAADQAAAGYGVEFEWDVDLLGGYRSVMLENVSAEPNVFRFAGCDTPDVGARLLRGGFDCVIVTGWYLLSHWQAITACRRNGIPLLVRGDSQLGTRRSAPKRMAKALGYRWLMSRFAGFLTVGQRNREYLEHYGADPARIFFAPHFVDNDYFGARATPGEVERQALRVALGISMDRRVALFVGRLLDLKRPADLIDALARSEVGGRRWQAVYVGAGPLEPSLRALATRRGVDAVFTGFKNQSELPPIYAMADVLVLPSASETWGLVVNEAMACGTPAVVTQTAGCVPDLIEPGLTGESYAAGDVDALARALERVAARGKSAEVRAALKHKLETYSCARAVAGTLEAVAQVTRRPPLRARRVTGRG